MHNILIAEALDTTILEAWEKKYREQFSIAYQPEITVSELEQQIAFYHGLIVRPKQVTEQTIANGAALQLIMRGGAGVNSIAVDAAKKRGIVVENTPGQNSTATVEYCFYLLLKLLARRSAEKAASDVLGQVATNPEDYAGYELEGKKIAIIGLGNIGKKMVRYCQSFGMEVIAYARHPKDVDVVQYRSLHEVIDAQPDVISLHVPLCAETEHMIGSEAIERIQHPLMLINTARPQLVDPLALKKGIEAGKVVSFAIDGDMEVIEPFIGIASAEQSILTHHIADATHEALAKITKQLLDQLEAYFLRGEIVNQV